MAITIFGGEEQRKAEATNTFAKKYPITSDVSAIQDNINKANVELVGLRNEQPTTAGGKRIRTRNINALTSWIMQMQNTINDLKSGMGTNSSNMTFAPPSVATILRKTDYSKLIPTTSIETILRTPLYSPVTDAVQEVITSTETPQFGAQGDYPPPQGAQGNKMLKFVVIGGSLLVIGVVALMIFKKKK
jgi:hypothetical protein